MPLPSHTGRVIGVDKPRSPAAGATGIVADVRSGAVGSESPEDDTLGLPTVASASSRGDVLTGLAGVPIRRVVVLVDIELRVVAAVG
ncbi:hypothetical protein [Rhodococcoides kroppenstedtii]|uniref:hypothetical protein n=1 Tax=Rhodococcoides kroppenstedtii TaxID=293050 RepID=UPI003631EA2E